MAAGTVEGVAAVTDRITRAACFGVFTVAWLALFLLGHGRDICGAIREWKERIAKK